MLELHQQWWVFNGGLTVGTSLFCFCVTPVSVYSPQTARLMSISRIIASNGTHQGSVGRCV